MSDESYAKYIWEENKWEVQDLFDLFREKYSIPDDIPLLCNACKEDKGGMFFYDGQRNFCENCFTGHIESWGAPMCYYRKYGLEIGEWIETQFKEMKIENNTYYEDNFRVAKVGEESEEKIYKEQVRNGCCGSVDETRIFKGDEYKLGFNFGH